MKEQIVAGILTLFLAVGFIFSIEVLAQTNRTVIDSCQGTQKQFCQNGASEKLKCKCSEEVKFLVQNLGR